ncbi:hypothetical protein FJR48_01960 [Sulfurimonas lithotrophica]|uniref:OmpA-like domain-containing protein n=1 Tax=Sulfurimonas lithotrophica TaxID=2590022 RepID=A0A5P8NYR4_9BACT|nr:hypothetical protein [Sulfurimonas lithotrophica]QFR48556.1 hypothetical protein FJR48_01960 [Sulfurimonas lithotrophica]
MKLLFIFAILFLSSFAFAKGSEYSLIIDKAFNNQLLDIDQDYDRSISAVGFVKNYKTSSNSTNRYTNAFDYLESVSSAHSTQMQLIKVDAGANILLDKTKSLSSFSEAVSLVKTPANGYYVGGHTMDGQLILLKLDAHANIIFKKIFGTKNLDRLKTLVKLRDGGVLAIGTSATSRDSNDPLFNTGLGMSDIYVTRFSKNGYKLWSKKYGTEFDDIGIDGVEANDGSLIIVAQTMQNSGKNLMLMRIDENGDKVWLKQYNDDPTVTPRKIIQLRDKNFLLSLSYKNELNKDQVRLLKFDINKNILSDKKIYTLYGSALLDIQEFSDEGIVGVGYVKDTFNTDALAMMFDSKLNMLYQEHYGDDNFDLLNSLVILNNSQIAAAGIHTSKNSQESNMWILKLNRDASIAQIASNTNEFYEKLCQLFSDEINTNKIRIKKDLTIELLDKRLLFKVSEYELNKIQKIFLKKFSNKLIPFLHKHQDMVDTLEINGHTSSEWGNVGFSQNFLKNEKLSMNRAYATMSFIFKNQTEKLQKYLGDVFKGSGYGFSKKIMLDNMEDREKSRRVSFKIILNEKK